MNDQPYAYQIWICSVCDNEAVEAGAHLVCESCGLTYSPNASGRAEPLGDDEPGGGGSDAS